MLEVLCRLKIIFHQNDLYVRKKVYFCATKKEIMTLRTYLEKDKQLPADIVDILDDLFEEVGVSKGETLIVEGSQSHKVFFVEEGITRLYYQKEGKDVTYTFIGEGQFYAPIENIFLKMYFPYNYEALEGCKLRVTDFSALNDRFTGNIAFNNFMNFVLTLTLKRLAKQIYSLKFCTAQERYEHLLEENPQILLRIPLGHIASYLGITQQTLSSIRAGK